MTAKQWWANLLNGSIGSFLSTAAVLGVFWLTLRHERSTEQDRRDADARTARDEAVYQSTARVIQLLTWPPPVELEEEVGKWLRDLMPELALLDARARRDTPELAAWAAAESQWMSCCSDADEREQRRLDAARDAGQYLAVADHCHTEADEARKTLSAWHAGKLTAEEIGKRAAVLDQRVESYDWAPWWPEDEQTK